jgi:HK97 family phage portal protein
MKLFGLNLNRNQTAPGNSNASALAPASPPGSRVTAFRNSLKTIGSRLTKRSAPASGNASSHAQSHSPSGLNLFGFNIARVSNRNSKIENLSRLGGDQKSTINPDAWALSAPQYCQSSPHLGEAFHEIAWVYRAVSIIAEQIATIPFVFSRGERGRESLITSGPLIDFYNEPHPKLNKFQYWEMRVLWLLLRGECFRLPTFEGGSHYSFPSVRKLKSIQFLNPDRMTPIIDDHEITGWRYLGSSQGELPSEVFLPEEIWYDRLPDPFNPWRGHAPMRVALQAIRTDHAASHFMRGVVESNADTGLIVRTADQLDDTQREQLLSHLRARRQSCGTPSRPLLLSSSCEVIQPTLSAADIQFLENRKFSRGEICSAFGVPEELVGSTDHNKYDVMRGARLNFIQNRIAPLCARLEAAERVTVRHIDPSAIGWFDIDSLPIMQDALNAKLQTAKIAFDMGIPINDLNRVLDLGFKPLPWGNQSYLPTNVHPVP